MTDAIHIIEQLQQAGSGQEIAGYLIRVPDAIVLSHGVQMQAECARHIFAAGVSFLNLRQSALQSVRDAHGLLPTWMGVEIELWRHTLSRYAAGERNALPDFMTTGASDGAPPG